LDNVPVAAALTVPVMVNVAVAPTGRLTSVEMEPEPLAAQVAPPATAQVHVAPVSPAGNVSVTVAPVTADGPTLVAIRVYVTGLPGVSEVTPLVLVMRRSAVPLSESVSVAELLAGVPSATPDGVAMVAVFTNEPVAVGAMLASNVYVTFVPAGRFTVSLIEPVPLAVHDAPEAATHVHVAPVSSDGKVSTTEAPMTDDGPLLEATIVYLVVVPAVEAVTPLVLVMTRSATGLSVLVSVAELLPATGSTTPLGALIDAELAIVPVAAAEMVPEMV
jgi:hypothetical protein